MKIVIRPILKVVELRDYDERMDSGQVFVWVNPPRAFLKTRDLLMQGLSQSVIGEDGGELVTEAPQIKYEKFNLGMFQWYAQLWSQSEDAETHWTAEEISYLSNIDPSFFNWLIRASSQMMHDHRTGEKKS